MDQKDYLLEEYKILEGRYRTDTARIWSQAQILIAANLLTVTALSALFTTSPNKERLVDPRYAISAVSVIGFAVSLVWFLSVVMDSAYQNVSLGLLRQMEEQLELPIKVFSNAYEEQKQFKPWARIGGANALIWLSFAFVMIWIVIGVAIWFVAL